MLLLLLLLLLPALLLLQVVKGPTCIIEMWNFSPHLSCTRRPLTKAVCCGCLTEHPPKLVCVMGSDLLCRNQEGSTKRHSRDCRYLCPTMWPLGQGCLLYANVLYKRCCECFSPASVLLPTDPPCPLIVLVLFTCRRSRMCVALH